MSPKNNFLKIGAILLTFLGLGGMFYFLSNGKIFSFNIPLANYVYIIISTVLVFWGISSFDKYLRSSKFEKRIALGIIIIGVLGILIFSSDKAMAEMALKNPLKTQYLIGYTGIPLLLFGGMQWRKFPKGFYKKPIHS